MESKGNAALLVQTRVTEWNLNQSGYISLAFGGFLLLGCVTAYLIAVARGNVEAYLPLISDAAGSPPQNGIFGTLICIGGMFGVVFMVLRYMIVLEKNREKSKLVIAINKISLFVGIISMLGITLVTGYPVNFYRNRDVWLMDVGLPHMIGGVMLFSLGLVYIAAQCILTLFLKPKNQLTLLVRVLILLICTSAFVYHMITVPEHFTGISNLYYNNNTDHEMNYTGVLPYPPTMGADLKIPIDTSGTYITSAITEWILVIFFCLFFFTFFSEAQQYSLLVIIETHSTQEPEVMEETDIRKMSLAVAKNGSQIDAKPAPEVRKFLRRDSTCQTLTDTVDKVIIPTSYKGKISKNGTNPSKKSPVKPPKIDVANGTKKLLINAEVEAKLNKLLNESEKNDDKNGGPKVKPATCEQSVGSDDSVVDNQQEQKDADIEAEKIAIGEIDVVVKDAEDLANEAGKRFSEEDNGILKNNGSEQSSPAQPLTS